MARLSRRKVVAALGSAPLLVDRKFTAATAADPVLLLCAHYGELARRQERLLRKWGDREAWLGDNRDWFNLSKAEQRALPEAQLLYAETPESSARREAAKDAQKYAPNPGSDLRGRPTKKARRQIRGFNDAY